MSIKLPVRKIAKPWGVDTLPPPFDGSAANERIGEIWFEPSATLPDLLIKYIFTSQKLSVQNHPSDAQTLAAGLGRQGKEECWLVIGANPGASLGIGFHEPLEREALRAAAIDGSIEQMMVWHPVSPGDFFYIPANTVHAIGAGVSLIEVQQNSDITYRLYDYGRPRNLHLDEGLAVADTGTYDAKWRRELPERGSVSLVDGPYFRLDRVDGVPDAAISARHSGRALIVPVEAAVTIAGETVAAGECAEVASVADMRFASAGLFLIASPLSRA